MSKFHINANGNAGACRAQNGNCPFGGASEHYETLEDARTAYEKNQAELEGTTQSFSKKKLSALGVDKELAEKIIASGFTLSRDSFYEELKEMPIYVGRKPDMNDRIRVTRRTYREDGTIKATEIHTGKIVPVEDHDGKDHGTGSLAIITDTVPFDEDEVKYLRAEELRRKTFDDSSGHWIRLRNNGPVNFSGGHGRGYIEHDTIERLGPPDSEVDEKNKVIAKEKDAIIEAKYKEEARARRPWPFNK